MGLTPLAGLVMGTRSGDLDPALPFYIMRKTGMSVDEMDKALNKKSGLLGITGKYTDRRDVEKGAEEGDALCKLGQEMEGYRIKKTIGAYAAALGKVDAIVFTAGVGEHSPRIRELATENLEILGVKMDLKKNALSNTSNAETLISADDSKVKIFSNTRSCYLRSLRALYNRVGGNRRRMDLFTEVFTGNAPTPACALCGRDQARALP